MLTLEAHQAAFPEVAEKAVAPDVERGVQAPVERPEATLCLLDLPRDGSAVIARVESPSPGRNPLPGRLAELGFLPGERVRIVARGALGGPVAVRVGTGTFALRREEAACVRVWPGATLK
jgi:ferrous iron transport protein A